MTQKELAYVEDAIGHEKNIIGICTEIKDKLKDKKLKSFIKEEITKHQEVQKELLELLEVKINDWWTTFK